MKHMLLFILPAVVGLYPLAAYAEKQTTAVILVNPPHSSIEMLVEGNQCTDLILRNQNFLGVTLSVPEPKPFQEDWDVILLPFGSRKKSYCVFATVPVQWFFKVSTFSDAANVACIAEWESFIVTY